ncbi:hypothetical protein WSM22_02530 [Cytophagales bacterium WSM2-2]|nr:hypothetical protein WSM22_02530 [Cytophagales bacterium WSM2-2]
MKPSEKPIDQLDQLFKGKLEDHTISPSEDAWVKVEAGLSKKNNVVLWRWAAAILLTGALITIIYQSQKNENTAPALTKKSIEKEKPGVAPEPKKIESTPAIAQTPRKIQSIEKRVEQNSFVSVNKEIQKTETVAVVEDQNKKLIQENSNPIQEKVEEKIKGDATVKREVASKRQKPIKLEFTLEDLSEEKVAATEEKSGLKKVLQLAREIKQGEGPMNDLREKKNELFARNLINGKIKNQ